MYWYNYESSVLTDSPRGSQGPQTTVGELLPWFSRSSSVPILACPPHIRGPHCLGFWPSRLVVSVFAPYTRIIRQCFMACVWLVPLSILFKRCVCVTVSCHRLFNAVLITPWLFHSPFVGSIDGPLGCFHFETVVTVLPWTFLGICWWTHLCISLGDIPQREIGYSCMLQWKLPSCFPKGLGRGTVSSSAGVPAFHIFANTWYCRLCFSHSGVCAVVS